MSGKSNKPKKPPLPKKPYAKTTVSGPDKIIKIAEDMRTLNSDGYNPFNPGLLMRIKGFAVNGVQAKGSACSTFSANVVGCALDPDYDTKDPATGEYVPMFNGGADPLPFGRFYNEHNGKSRIAGSLVEYNVGESVAAKEMRRGDVLGIGWMEHGGHTGFCWDVHLDAKGDVDCFQFIGCNGRLAGQEFTHDAAGLKAAQAKVKAGTDNPSVLGGWGVTISGCEGKEWLTGEPATYKSQEKEVDVETSEIDPATGERKTVKKYKVKAISCTKVGTLAKAKDKIFVDDVEVSRQGYWYTLPGVDVADIDREFAKGRRILARIESLQVGRLYYTSAPPEPTPHAPVAGTDKQPGHAEAPAQVVKGADLAANPRAKDKVKAVPAKQSSRTLLWQHYVEYALQVFHATQWIAEDPGRSQDINDRRTQAALRAYQSLFGLAVDGKIGPQTLGSMMAELPICTAELGAQHMLQQLWKAGKISTNPGVADGINHGETRAAVEEFQRAHALSPTGVPDSKTYARLRAVVESHAPTPEAPGLRPDATNLYWVGNVVPLGGTAKLRLHSVDLRIGEQCTVQLHDETTRTNVKASVELAVGGAESEVEVPIPFGAGASVQARVATQSAGEISTVAPLRVGRATEAADWRPYIDADRVPDEIIEKIRRNRALWPAKKLTLVTRGKYAGPKHYDYKPPKTHGEWARDYVATAKVEGARSTVEKMIALIFLHMMKSESGAEGQPASLQTYDNQIVTWGVGFGARGDGVHVFEQLDGDAKMRRLLDDLGVQYFGGRYHVVHLGEQRVISSVEIKKLVRGRGKNKGKMIMKHDSWNHLPPLEAWRSQEDALCAIIGISEDPAYRVQILEAQWRVYLSNSTTWAGQDKVRSFALFYLLTHAQHWLPWLAKHGFDVEREWLAIGGSTPSFETDSKLAQRLLNGFIEAGKELWRKTPGKWREVLDRVRKKLWPRFRVDAQKEGFDPGEFIYAGEE